MSKFERCDPLDRDRCPIQLKDGNQCPYKRTENTPYCPMHMARSENAFSQTKARNFRLTKWQARMEELADNPQVKSLREEIGIMRILLEEIVNQCNDANDLLMYAGKISDTVIKIEKLVASCHRLEQSTGLLLDKTAILQLASLIIDIIGEHIEDENTLQSIGDRIVKCVITNQKESSDAIEASV